MIFKIPMIFCHWLSFLHCILCMIFQEEYFPCYVLSNNQISLSGWLYFLRYWAVCVLEEFLYSIWWGGRLETADLCLVNIYLFKVNNRNTREMCEICSKLIRKTPEWRQWRLSGVFVINFEYISHLVSLFLLLNLGR